MQANDHVARVLAHTPQAAKLVALELRTMCRLLFPADETDSDATSEDAKVAGRRVSALSRRSRQRIQNAFKTAMETHMARCEFLEVITVSPNGEHYYKLALQRLVL